MIVAFIVAAACHVGGQAPFVKPDDQCTPGSYESLSVTQSCVHKQRPRLSFDERRLIVTSYGVPNWSGADGELDHRVPFFLGGTTDRANIWPEVGSIPNAKDKLEFYIYDRVCKNHTMRATTARARFLGDWVAQYRRYRLDSATLPSAPVAQ